MKLILQHCANPDVRGGYWDSTVDPKKTTAEVGTQEEAKQVFETWRDRNRLGGGNMARGCGALWDGKNLLGQFSYNGRFWPVGSEYCTVKAA